MRACIDVVLRILTFGWFARGKSETAANDRREFFPQTFELIPGKLRVTIFDHDVENGPSKIPCWSFVSDGLISQKQKEIIVTLQRPRGARSEDYPRELLNLFLTFFDLAQQGRTVDVGDVTFFSRPVALKAGSYGGLGYTKSKGFVGVETPCAPAIAGILLKLDEVQVAREFGLTRILALLGLQNRYYPHPRWSDLQRGPIATLESMQYSALRGAARITVVGSFYEEHNHVHLSLSSSSAPKLARFLNEIPPDAGLALRLQPDPHANACFVWSPALPHPAAITPDGSDASRKTGNFLAFGAHEQMRDIRNVEDGYVALISKSVLQKICNALKSGSDVTLSEGGLTISVEWQKARTYTSPVTGETTISEDWTEYTPDPIGKKRARVAVDSGRIVLLTKEAEFEAHANIEDLGHFVNRIEDVVDAFFSEPILQRELVVHVDALPEGVDISAKAEPELSSEQEHQLQRLLAAIQAPKVTGLVKFEYLFELWNVKTSVPQ